MLATALLFWTLAALTAGAAGIALRPLADRLLTLSPAPEVDAPTELATPAGAAHRSVHCHERVEQ